ncbi:MAG: succinylglutamate desuccinylase/aspartoacylase family protein [Anaerolineae bacterium]|nr:succinylglutamate desuccinylase/aspartoacylase family protein [Anaerolineae bacterium]
MTWQRIPVGAGAAIGAIELAVGSVGNGKPVGLITAGIHGDEGPWGLWAIHKLWEQTSLDDLQGTLRIVPVANPLAMEADARNAPLDTLDLNRVFPGNPDGSHTERLAAALVTHAVDGADVVIDIHGGGSWCVNAFAFRFAGGEKLTEAIGAPFIVDGPERTVTLTGYARTKGAAVAAIEMGGRSEYEERWADRIASGLRRALCAAGVLTDSPSLLAERGAGGEVVNIPVGPSTVLRPSRGGIFMPQVRASAVGTIVTGGTVLGYLLDPVTRQVIETFTAPYPRTALLLIRPMIARIEGGAMTYVIAEPVSL